MANITAKDVATLREMTGCGMMDCKKALVEAEGNFDEAVKILREKGLAKAAKKAGRIAAEGVVYSYVCKEKNTGVVVEINAETDFVAKNEQFTSFVKIVADTIINCNPADVEALKAMKAEGTEMTVADLLTEKVSTIGENIQIRRFTRLEGTLVAYIHDNGRIGTLVKVETDIADDNADLQQCIKDVALQVTAMNPQYVSSDVIPASVIENEKEIQKNLVIQEGKPANVAEKIVEGRMRKYYEEVCLLNQAFFKDDTMTVGKYVENTAAKLGGKITVVSFTRYEKGEGIEKKADDFASEVASMMQ